MMENDGSVKYKVVPYDYANLKVGDEVIRWLAGTIPMKMKVTALTNDVITCEWWTFDRKTGVEIDDDIPGVVSFLGKSCKKTEGK
jgi:hypothetical protein